MYANVNTPIKRGQTYYGGNVPTSTYWKETAMIEGLEAVFEDTAPATARGQVLVKRSGRPVKCRLVRNASAGSLNLLPQMMVTYLADYQFKRVAGNVRLDAAECAGVVDEHLPAAGVVVGDLFWIVYDGPTLVKASLDSTEVAAGDMLVGLTAATSGATTSGRVCSYAVTSDTTTMSPRMTNRVGWAVSARTAAETNKAILANIRLP